MRTGLVARIPSLSLCKILIVFNIYAEFLWSPLFDFIHYSSVTVVSFKVQLRLRIISCCPALRMSFRVFGLLTFCMVHWITFWPVDCRSCTERRLSLSPHTRPLWSVGADNYNTLLFCIVNARHDRGLHVIRIFKCRFFSFFVDFLFWTRAGHWRWVSASRFLTPRIHVKHLRIVFMSPVLR